MPSKQSQKAVTAKMYRHFAVITVAVTGALALATNDEGASAFNGAVDERTNQAASAGQGVKSGIEPELVNRMADANEIPPAATGWAPDVSVDFGDLEIGGGASFIPAELRTGGIGSMLRQLGMTQEQYEALPTEQQKQLVEDLANGRPDSQQQRNALSASLARSGGEGTCEDC